MKNDKHTKQETFVHIHQTEESGHAIGINHLGKAFSWSIREKGPSNEFGQLGRGPTMGNSKILLSTPLPVIIKDDSIEDKDDATPNDSFKNVRFLRGYTGGSNESGHSALLDISRRHLFICGCDRWQQLGLGSPHGGAVGYTWKGGKLWQTEFHRNEFVDYILENEHQTIRDVALGGDHTVIVTEEKRDVYTFGRGGNGQLGGVGKPFVSAPMRSKSLSSRHVASVCAVKDCTLTLDKNGNTLKKAGHCRMKDIQKGIELCIQRAKEDGLINLKSI